MQEATTRFLDLGATDSAEGVIDVVGVSWGLTTIGKGEATFTEPGSKEAQKILKEMEQKVSNRRDAVSDDWMKSTLHACGLVTSKASNEHVDHISNFNGR